MVHPPDGLLYLVGLTDQGQQQHNGTWAGCEMLRVPATVTGSGNGIGNDNDTGSASVKTTTVTTIAVTLRVMM